MATYTLCAGTGAAYAPPPAAKRCRGVDGKGGHGGEGANGTRLRARDSDLTRGTTYQLLGGVDDGIVTASGGARNHEPKHDYGVQAEQ